MKKAIILSSLYFVTVKSNDAWSANWQFPGDVTFDGDWGPPLLVWDQIYMDARKINNNGAKGFEAIHDHGTWPNKWGIHQKSIVTSTSECVVETADLVGLHLVAPNQGWNVNHLQRMECVKNNGDYADRLGPPLAAGPDLPNLKDGYGPNFTTYNDDPNVYFEDEDWNMACADLCARENIRRSNLPITGDPDEDRHRNMKCYSYSKVMHPDNTDGTNKFMCQLNQCTVRQDVLDASNTYFNDVGVYTNPALDNLRGWYSWWTAVNFPGSSAATAYQWTPSVKERTGWIVSGCGLDSYLPLPNKIEFNHKWEYVGDTPDKHLFHPSASGDYLFVPYRDEPASGTSYIEVHKFNPSTNGYDLLPEKLSGPDFNFFYTGSCENQFLVYSKNWNAREFGVRNVNINDNNVNNWVEQVISVSSYNLDTTPNRNVFQFSEDCSVMAYFDAKGGIVRFDTSTWTQLGNTMLGTYGIDVENPVALSPSGSFAAICDKSVTCTILDYIETETNGNPITSIFTNPGISPDWGKAIAIDNRGSAYVLKSSNELIKYTKEGDFLVDISVSNIFTNNMVVRYNRLWGGTDVAYNIDQMTIERNLAQGVSVSGDRILVPNDERYIVISGGNTEEVTIAALTNTIPTSSPTSSPSGPPTPMPTDPPTDPPTPVPTDPPTDPPTPVPTDPPTDPPTSSNNQDFCSSNTCLNGGTCSNSMCHCLFPYYGVLCADIRPCTNSCIP